MCKVEQKDFKGFCEAVLPVHNSTFLQLIWQTPHAHVSNTTSSDLKKRDPFYRLLNPLYRPTSLTHYYFVHMRNCVENDPPLPHTRQTDPPPPYPHNPLSMLIHIYFLNQFDKYTWFSLNRIINYLSARHLLYHSKPVFFLYI